METYYKPVFLWEGKKPIVPFIQEEVEQTILANIHAFAQHLNPHIQDWNANYTGPEDQTAEDGGLKDTKDSIYLMYLYDHMVEAMKKFKPVKDSSFIKEWTVNDEMCLAARTYAGALVSIYWKPVEI